LRSESECSLRSLTEKDWLYIPADIETPETGLKFGTKILAHLANDVVELML
jgi:hypothetical protein